MESLRRMLPKRARHMRAMAATMMAMALIYGAQADSLRLADPDDSPGGFDIAEIHHAHFTIQGTGQRLIRHDIRTEERWSWADLLDANNRFEFWFNLDDDAQPERRLTVYGEADGTPVAEMDDPFSTHVFGYAKVWRPSPRKMLVEFPRRLLKRHLGDYSWYVRSVYHKEGHPECGTVDDMVLLCADRAPNGGWVTHRETG